MVNKKALMIIGCLVLSSCTFKSMPIYDGRVEATVTRLSAQSAGVVSRLLVDEGAMVARGATIAVINSERLAKQLDQIEADLTYASAQLVEVRDLVAHGAATAQRRDELIARVKNLRAQRDALHISLRDSSIVAPYAGTIVTRFVRQAEYVAPGTPLVDIADLTVMEVRIFVALDQLPQIRLGMPVKVFVAGEKKPLNGTVVWIASEAEFTPKTILTQETKTTLVYAVKIRVPNQAQVLKIGMPVDVRW